MHDPDLQPLVPLSRPPWLFSPAQVKDEIAKYKVGAPARVGAQANDDVVIKAGPTGMDPSQTSFFQALGIATKINKGSIEIVSDVVVVKNGDRVGASQATLLAKLGIKPFKYGLAILKVRRNRQCSAVLYTLSCTTLLRYFEAAEPHAITCQLCSVCCIDT